MKSDVDPHRVVVALSGGVDSAVAALLLQEARLEVQAVTLRLWRAPFASDSDAVPSAQAVAAALGIPCTVLDLTERFYQEVIRPFVAAYGQGRTPNPCVFCNPTLKFAALLAAAAEYGAAWIATGHYARVLQAEGTPTRLLRAHHARRDQSYVLYRLDQPTLSRLRLPLGEVADKAAVRALARQRGLPAAERTDSQDLCFLGPRGDYRALLRHLAPESLRPGPIYDEAGQRLGEHQGLPLYTVGQREGLGLNVGRALYVLQLDAAANALIVGPPERLARERCKLEAVTFTAGAPPAPCFQALAQPRYHAPVTPAQITLLPGEQAQVVFATAVAGLTPGQSLVFYHEDEVLGGGVIARW